MLCNVCAYAKHQQGDLESVASLFGRTVALRRGHQWSPEQEKDAGILLDSRVRVVMQTMKKRLIDQHEGPLQVSCP